MGGAAPKARRVHAARRARARDAAEERHARRRAEALDKAWDSTDDRLGQVVYDNLFWNRTGKDLAHALVRSVGGTSATFASSGAASPIG
jgi:hypothetical protein